RNAIKAIHAMVKISAPLTAINSSFIVVFSFVCRANKLRCGEKIGRVSAALLLTAFPEFGQCCK
ncbi:hypothetical protein OEB59_RS25775, partial [Escherichia coli]